MLPIKSLLVLLYEYSIKYNVFLFFIINKYAEIVQLALNLIENIITTLFNKYEKYLHKINRKKKLLI